MTANIVTVKSVTKAYGERLGLNNFSVEIPHGRVGLVGANGAGKSTLFRCMLGLTKPTRGSITVTDIDVATDPLAARSRLGYMPEHECLPLDQSAADAVAMFAEVSGLPARAARQRASDMLDLVGLDEARFRSIGEFSTGMRQRAKLAAALVGGPELLLLDEPTSGLDPSGRDEMLDIVSRLGDDGVSVIMSTHLLGEVQRTCEYVIMIDQGTLVVAGQTQGLLSSTGRISVEIDGPIEGLVANLQSRGLTCEWIEGHLEITASDSDGAMDVVRDVVADLGLPLVRLSSEYRSLDDVFLANATAMQ